ncbi:PAS domain S-box protein [Halioglobus maricola]|uniref:Sensor protein FixL n=1 Tax=Halioglobus maricola TaxID=2601894 RepID=A0A5P9NF38_9GAMM|nr:sigma 54-interacting transcriptional regulator [Halioglobus maricola]QFU74370.1 PAS domain S-box protein [Halioglobus maricola]
MDRIESSDWYMRLLTAITNAQSQLIGTVERKQLFDGLLSALLELSDSEYGFIGETHLDEEGKVFLRTHAITNIAWNEYTRRHFEENAPNGLEFHNLETLFGHVMTEEKPVIANEPQNDSRRGGLPLGHPDLNSFLGVPLHSAGRMIGMIGIANRPEGYDEKLINDLAPFLQTCANAIFALRAESDRRQAADELSDEQQRLRAILDGAYEAIITIDERGIIESANQRAEQMFGYSQLELRGENVSNLMPTPYRLEHDTYIKNYLETGDAKVIGQGREVLGRHRDGKEFPIHLTVNETNVQGSRLFIGMLRDLSERAEADKQLKQLQRQLDRSRFGQLIGKSQGMRNLYRTINDVANGDWTVLIEGETGTGKELVARAIHAASPRSNGPFIAVNSAALSSSLLGSQLFGHRRGAFSGAVKDQTGYFQAADGGTLFLDEIGDISEDVQVSLLRAIESAEVAPLGQPNTEHIDLRIIAATNRNLGDQVAAGSFREDLLYRLRVGRVLVPPLRERREDIPLLAEAFLAEMRVETGKAIASIAAPVVSQLSQYNWPGNVRELRSAIQFATIHCHSGSISLSDLPPELLSAQSTAAERATTAPDFQQRLQQALEQAGGNRTKAARLLGISRATLYRKLKELQLDG